MTNAGRIRCLLPALWAGWLLCVALLAAPAAFATLLPSDAARIVNRIFAYDAYATLLLGVVVVLLERAAAGRDGGPAFGAGVALALAAIACAVAGYFALLPMMAAARVGEGRLSFGQLHAVSVALFAVKLACVFALAWRALGSIRPSSSDSAASAGRA